MIVLGINPPVNPNIAIKTHPDIKLDVSIIFYLNTFLLSATLQNRQRNYWFNPNSKTLSCGSVNPNRL